MPTSQRPHLTGDGYTTPILKEVKSTRVLMCVSPGLVGLMFTDVHLVQSIWGCLSVPIFLLAPRREDLGMCVECAELPGASV